MSDNADKDDDIDWKSIVKSLRKGNTVEIPCADERDYARRTKQVVKRVGKRDIDVDVHRGEGVLRVVRRRDADGTARAEDGGAGETPTLPG
jgi:hypothetical protein